ncbi:MAG: hypothetical protein ACHP7I_03935 [Terriglobales bacterium]
MTYRLRSVGVLSVAKVSGIFHGAMGLLFVPFFLLISMIGAVAGKQTGAPAFPAVIGIGLALVMPVLYAGMGFLFGAFGAFVYNLVAGWIGGFEMEFQTTNSGDTAVGSAMP